MARGTTIPGKTLISLSRFNAGARLNKQEQLGGVAAARVRSRKQVVVVTNGENLGAFSSFGGEASCVNLLISVRMRAPFAPHMSFGSRATQEKPEARISCSERLRETASFSAGNREFVSARARRASKTCCARIGPKHCCASRC
jgi:hypothetical protein